MAIDYQHRARPRASAPPSAPPQRIEGQVPSWLAPRSDNAPAAQRPPAVVPPAIERDPETFLQQTLAAAVAQHDELDALTADVTRLRGLADAVYAARGATGPAVGVDQEALERERVDPRDVYAMIRRYDTAFGMTGAVRKATLAPRIEDARRAIHRDLAARLGGAERALDARRQHHLRQLDELRQARPEVDHFTAERLYTFDDSRAYIGAMAARLTDGTIPFLPWASWHVLPLPDAPWSRVPFVAETGSTWLTGPGADYAAGCAFARNQVLDQMANAFPRQLLVTWVDPVGRGASAGTLLELLETDKDLLDTQVWAEPQEIDRALRRITDRMSYLEQRCLKSRFANLDEYNLQAGSLAEPRHTVVVTGYPRNFTAESLQRLDQIQQSSRRLGITVHVVTDDSVEAPLVYTQHGYPSLRSVRFRGADGQPELHGHLVFGHRGEPHVGVWCTALGTAVWLPMESVPVPEQRARAIVDGYARAAIEAGTVAIDADQLTVPAGGPPASTVEEIVLPVGVLGRGDRFDLRLGRGLAQNVLVGGLPGSGKSTLFHTLITAAARCYDPSELELYLLDFKEGVEFRPYASAALPHARGVAVQSERAFGLSVLRGLCDELTRRATAFKTAGAASIGEFRARTGAVMPRVLVVVDEFQVLFAAEDATSFECASLLENLIRQGRSYGVHLVLGTQTLRGATQRILGPALDLVAVRVALKTSEPDSELFLAPDNRAASRLTRPGEAVFNPDGGRPEGNLTVQVAITSDRSRAAVLDAATARARATGWTRRPLVFDGTAPVDVRDDPAVAAELHGTAGTDPRSIPLHVGLPVAIGGSGSVALRRRGGAHVLITGRDGDATLGPLVVGLTTAWHSTARPAITIVDCLGVDDEHGTTLDDTARRLRGIAYSRRRKLAEVLTDTAAELTRRLDEDDYSAPRRLVVINALHRARELDEDSGFDPSSATGLLTAILRDGGDVGIHMVITTDTADSLHRRIGRQGLAHIGMRIVGQCSPAASDALVGSAAATDLRGDYLLVSDADENRLEQVRPFPLPDAAWLDAAATPDRNRAN